MRFIDNEIGYAVSGTESDCDVTNIVIPDTHKGRPVIGIANNAFRGCSKLTNITIPDSVMRIGAWAFYGCSSLTSITIPRSVTRVGYAAFSLCSSLTNITIPNSVTKIGGYAFDGCDMLCKKGQYKAFNIRKDKRTNDIILNCRRQQYKVGKTTSYKGDLKFGVNGLHYVTNLFEIFNYYSGKYDKDFVIAEIKVYNKSVGAKGTSTRCARCIKPIHILTREELCEKLSVKGEAAK